MSKENRDRAGKPVGGGGGGLGVQGWVMKMPALESGEVGISRGSVEELGERAWVMKMRALEPG